MSVTVNAVGAMTARGSDTFTYDQASRLTSATIADFLAGTAVETAALEADLLVVQTHLLAGPAVPVHAALAVGDVAFALITFGAFAIHRVACE